MAPKGLAIGESFKDGERTYYVLKVLADGNYISSATPPEEESEEPKRRGRPKKEGE